MKIKLIYSLAFVLMACGINAQEAIYKNKDLPAQQRAEDLVKRLTLQEKIGLMMNGSKPVERLGIKPYNWWNEALHGNARNGYATVFPQPIGLAATFDPDLVYHIFSAVSDETRAKNTISSKKGIYAQYRGLTMWTPNINIFRDPRWGRGMETYGEDPYLTSVMGVSVVNGLQGNGSGAKYDKLHACAKHFAVHSGPEWNRHSFDVEKLSLRDLHETYLPAFKSLVEDANVKEVMCAYNSFDGKPCCGSDKLLVQILRKEWNYDGIILSDCGAINDFYEKKAHNLYPDAASASSAAVLSGTDLECGGSYWSLSEGVKRGLINEKDIDRSVTRLLKARFELGEMDNIDDVSWSKIPSSVICSSANDSLSLDAARKSMTLLVNKYNTLPLNKNIKNIAVIGPNANDSIMLWGNYNGTPTHTVSILDGIKSVVGSKCNILYEPACSWVERKLIKSVFSDCTNNGKRGFSAEYWNNKQQQGTPVATQQYSSPFALCTSGNTVFAPNVNLTGFSGKYSTTFIPKESGDVVFEVFLCGKVQLMVNKEVVKEFTSEHGGMKYSYVMPVKVNENYDITLNFEYFKGDAQFNFDLGFKEDMNIKKVVDDVKNCDAVIFVGGISPTLEGEEMGVDLPGFKGGDRTDIELPAVQREMIAALHDAGKKIIFVSCSGSPLAMVSEVSDCDAILQAWYPGQDGGKAVADVLFGNYNPAGRLPVTMYKNSAQLPDFEDYNMKGHTYRYFAGKPLFAFGYGLSYSSFEYGDVKMSTNKINAKTETLRVVVPVKNISHVDGDEVVQLYLKKIDDPDGPNKTLRAFKRVMILAGKTVNVELTLKPEQLVWWNKNCNAMDVTPGKYYIMVGNCSDDKDMKVKKLIIK